MTQVSRRRFLSHGSFGIALAGMLAAVPGLSAVLRLSAATHATVSTAEPLIAHVRDMSRGEISLMVGTKHVIHRDADLATRLYNAAREES